jgi:hypothetical protein
VAVLTPIARMARHSNFLQSRYTHVCPFRALVDRDQVSRYLDAIRKDGENNSCEASSMRKINVVRKSGFFAIFRSLKLVVDENHCSSIKNGKSVEIQIPSDACILVGCMDWGKTHSFSLDGIEDGETIMFKPYLTVNLLRYLGILELPFRISKQ